MSLQDTPRANRLHIGIFGRRNAGKSSLLNAITGQQHAIVSEVAGTTADAVYKSMEIHGLGPCVLIDTAGFDDEGELGQLRVQETEKAALKTDVALLVFAPGQDLALEKAWLEKLLGHGIPVIPVLNKADIAMGGPAQEAARAKKELGLSPVLVSAGTGAGISQLRQQIIRVLPEDYEQPSITGELVEPGDRVLLVMPQDIQAPKGRLILPQVQVTRDLLDRSCVIVSATADLLDAALAAMAAPPDLIITDSQVFPLVYQKKPPESRLTSFSVLMAGYKGDINTFVEGAAAIEALTEKSRVLIAEACAHAPLAEDIGREKLPRMLRQKAGQGLAVDFVRGGDFPEDLTGYDLVLHCGACMFNRRLVLERIRQARDQKVPITNYGVALAALAGILDKICY